MVVAEDHDIPREELERTRQCQQSHASIHSTLIHKCFLSAQCVPGITYTCLVNVSALPSPVYLGGLKARRKPGTEKTLKKWDVGK